MLPLPFSIYVSFDILHSLMVRFLFLSITRTVRFSYLKIVNFSLSFFEVAAEKRFSPNICKLIGSNNNTT